MWCPNCREESDVKWMLRHQKSSEEDTATNANVVTVLCIKCGKNASAFIEDYLPEIFPEWDETPELIQKYIEEQKTLENGTIEGEVVNDMPIEDN